MGRTKKHTHKLTPLQASTLLFIVGSLLAISVGSVVTHGGSRPPSEKLFENSQTSPLYGG